MMVFGYKRTQAYSIPKQNSSLDTFKTNEIETRKSRQGNRDKEIDTKENGSRKSVKKANSSRSLVIMIGH